MIGSFLSGTVLSIPNSRNMVIMTSRKCCPAARSTAALSRVKAWVEYRKVVPAHKKKKIQDHQDVEPHLNDLASE